MKRPHDCTTTTLRLSGSIHIEYKTKDINRRTEERAPNLLFDWLSLITGRSVSYRLEEITITHEMNARPYYPASAQKHHPSGKKGHRWTENDCPTLLLPPPRVSLSGRIPVEKLKRPRRQRPTIHRREGKENMCMGHVRFTGYWPFNILPHGWKKLRSVMK